MTPQVPGQLQTFHAPPGRLPLEEILSQAAALGNVAALLDCIPDAAMILNEQRQIIFANQALQKFKGNRVGGQVLGLRAGELFDCREVGRAPSGCGTGEACRTCGAVNAMLSALAGKRVTHECRIATTVIEALDLRIAASPFRGPTGEFALVIATDIGNEKRREVLERLFFHDILNTAGSIQGMTELIRSDPTYMEVFKEDLCETAETLVNEIHSQRVLLAAEQRALAVTFAQANSLQQLDTVVKAYRRHPVATGKTIVIAPGAGSFMFETDEALLQRVLGNLLKNALEASAPGDTVELSAEGRSGESVFWCHNRQHISKPVQLQLFHRSFSTKGPGRGLGTYSIRLLTERYLGGRVVCISRPETGTRFELRFPTM